MRGPLTLTLQTIRMILVSYCPSLTIRSTVMKRKATRTFVPRPSSKSVVPDQLLKRHTQRVLVQDFPGCVLFLPPLLLLTDVKWKESGTPGSESRLFRIFVYGYKQVPYSPGISIYFFLKKIFFQRLFIFGTERDRA